MTLPPDKKLPWWREPMVWLVAGLPVAAVMASFATLWIAVRNADTLVKEGYLKEGFTVQEVLPQDHEAVRLGLSGQLIVESSGLRIVLAGLAQPEATLQLVLAHPTEATRDLILQLERNQAGVYLAALPDLPPGKRHVLLETTHPGWRLHGSWDAPLVGQINLAPIGNGH